MVELPGERMGILFGGSPVPHKHPRRPPLGQVGWAWWRKGRLVALEAKEEGSFALCPLIVRGRVARLNVSTSPGGYVQVEASSSKGKPLPGRRFEDCDPISGDFLDRVVTWRGESDLAHNDSEPIVLRLRLRVAELFSITFGES
jgi:hypothetical protein